MPELPEVETIVRTLTPKVVGRIIAHVQLNRQDIVAPADLELAPLLNSRTITALRRRGKRVIFQLDNGQRFYIHLGMSGRLGLHNSDAPIARHTHLILTFGTDLHLRFTDPRRFGGLFWLTESDKDEGTMGPEPLTITPAILQSQLSGSKRPTKNALMDQTVIAGLGNIYVDESLFTAGIHPLRRTDKLTSDEIRRLTQSIKQVLRRAIKHKGSTLRDYVDANGNKGRAQTLHRIYARNGKPCVTCKSEIRKIVLGGRSTCFCPKCQPR
jgi:formamidopyrimidine-DNA glycosylase